MKNLYFNFEIYTCNPKNPKEGGWDIMSVSVKAETKVEAREKLKNFPLFDVVILFNFQHEEEEDANFLTTELWPKYKVLERM